jgi:hypothetical protein
MGSYLTALLLMRLWLGYSTLDIQLHNTYFILRAPEVAVLLASHLAVVAAVGRLTSGYWRTHYTVAALTLLVVTWLLLVALLLRWLKSGLRVGHV